MLIDYLKKELELVRELICFFSSIFTLFISIWKKNRNFSKLKDQFNTREKCIIDLENRIKEFRTIEMIYKGKFDMYFLSQWS